MHRIPSLIVRTQRLDSYSTRRPNLRRCRIGLDWIDSRRAVLCCGWCDTFFHISWDDRKDARAVLVFERPFGVSRSQTHILHPVLLWSVLSIHDALLLISSYFSLFFLSSCRKPLFSFLLPIISLHFFFFFFLYI